MPLKDFFVKKILFPKVISVDYPGIILSESTMLFFTSTKKRRNFIMFEDIISSLQNDTARHAGQEKAEEMWLNIGRNTGNSWLAGSSAGKKAVPRFIKAEAIEHAFALLASSGGSCAEKVDIKRDAAEIEIKGHDNIICRFSGIPGYAEGFAAVMLRSITGDDYVPERLCRVCPGKCHLRFRRKNAENLPDRQADCPSPNTLTGIPAGKDSFSEFVRFKKIKICDDGKITLFDTIYLMPTIPTMAEIIFEEYASESLEQLMQASVSRSILRISRRLFANLSSERQKLSCFESVHSALGLGILNTYKRNDHVRAVVRLPLDTEPSRNRFYASFLLHFYEAIYERNLKHKRTYRSGDSLSLEFS